MWGIDGDVMGGGGMFHFKPYYSRNSLSDCKWAIFVMELYAVFIDSKAMNRYAILMVE